MIDWSKGFTASYHASFVDPGTWRDMERIEITEGSISRQDSELRQSADMTCTSFDGSKERWVRIWLDARQGGASDHVALFTGLATNPDRDIKGWREEHKVACLSVLQPAKDRLLERGWYAPTDTPAKSLITDLLSVTPAPVSFASELPRLKSAIVSEDGETSMSMTEKILQAVGCRMRIDGQGEIVITDEAASSVAFFSATENDSIEPEITVTRDWYEVPNVFRAVDGDTVAIARDDSEDSPYSTYNRGREVWAEEISPKYNEGETLAEYALRQLQAAQKVTTTVKYDRRYDPDIYPSDIIELKYPGQGIQGLYRIVSQSIELGYGCKTTEEAEAWTR